MRIQGPYTRPDGRVIAIVTKDDGKKTTASYPKLLMEEHLKRKLTGEEVVHHKDGNPSNNDLSNLEVQTRKYHGRGHNRKRPMIQVCPQCNEEFEPKRSNQICCSYGCNSKKNFGDLGHKTGRSRGYSSGV